MSRKTVIISAGGTGKRMGTDLPKQFLEISGKPLIFRTIEKFLQADPEMEIIVVLPEGFSHLWEELCGKHDFHPLHKITTGGTERFHSIRNGLHLATGDLIAVHDAVRPFVQTNVIQACFNAARNYGAAIPVLSIHESVRKVGNSESIAVNRDDYKLVQTPQCFQSEILHKAYQQDFSAAFTDDASVVEANGTAIHLVEGNRENIKITTPWDLKFAEFIVKHHVV